MSQGRELATLDDYRAAGDFLVIAPVVEIAQQESAASPWLIESVSIVRISTEKGSPDVYHDFRYAPESQGLFALSALGLAKIAAAAGIKWIPELTGLVARERRPSGHVYIRYRAAGAIRQLNGEWHIETGEKEIDTEDEAEQIEEAYRRKLASGRARFKEEEIPDMVRREVLQIREFILGHAETKAKNRVIRRVLSLKQVFSAKDLSRPLAIPRLLHRPEVADSEARLQIEGGRSSAEMLFGDAAALGSGSVQEEPQGALEAAPAPAPDAPAAAPPADPPKAEPQQRRRGTTTKSPPKEKPPAKKPAKPPEPEEPPLEEPPGWEQEPPAAEPVPEQPAESQPAPSTAMSGTEQPAESREDLLARARELFAPGLGTKVADARLVAAGKMLHDCSSVDDLDAGFLRELIHAREAFTKGSES